MYIAHCLVVLYKSAAGSPAEEDGTQLRGEEHEQCRQEQVGESCPWFCDTDLTFGSRIAATFSCIQRGAALLVVYGEMFYESRSRCYQCRTFLCYFSIHLKSKRLFQGLEGTADGSSFPDG